MREYKLIAHRGSHKFAKENSLFSFFNAINENYYGFECDVRQSKDKKFYIYHDMLYDGKLFKSFNSNEIICDTLESVLKLNTNKIILLEIKDPFIDIDNLVETLIKYSDKNIYVMSFYNTVIDKLNIKNKTYKVGILNYVLNTNKKYSEKEKTDTLLYPTLFIGLTTSRHNLYDRINKRVEAMINNGLIDEAKKIYDTNIRSKAVMTPIGYKELFMYFDNEISLENAIDLIKQRSRKYAKRQYTWFNNQMNIKWFNTDYDNFSNTIKEVVDYIECQK